MYLDEFTHLYIPAIYAVVNNKSEFTYKAIFQYVLNNLVDIEFKNYKITITMDFEKGMINSIKNVFPNARLVGCHFHFMQSLIRNSKKLGFGKNKYKDEISELINKKLGILPYIYNGNINNLKDILSEKNL